MTSIHIGAYPSTSALAHDVAAYALSGARKGSSNGGTVNVQSIEKFAASQFSVFARPQTAKDRSLPAVTRRAVKLGGLGPSDSRPS